MNISGHIAGILLLLFVSLPALPAEDDPAPRGSEAPTTPIADADAGQGSAETKETLPEPSADLRDVLARPAPVFIPSEAIDVDKPVDFPTNI